ncbi:MAG: nitrous oxide-stimulated promoter family protein [Paludibacter sp.]|nr:nitrous oxide-stimulated promoter family protein [Paludibacter sp.]
MASITKEKLIVGYMIRLYCRNNHNCKELCSECKTIKMYALNKLSKCPYGNNKTACKECKTHCYKTEMREKIREVMRYSGPRMIIYYPMCFFRHLIKK